VSAQKSLNLGDDPQFLALPGGMYGAQQLVLSFSQVPTSGTFSIQVLPVGSSEWGPLSKATNLPASGAPYFIRSAGWIGQVRIKFDGVVGGAGGVLWAEQIELPANAEFIVAITNTGSGAARAQYFLDYYQGGTDLPI